LPKPETQASNDCATAHQNLGHQSRPQQLAVRDAIEFIHCVSKVTYLSPKFETFLAVGVVFFERGVSPKFEPMHFKHFQECHDTPTLGHHSLDSVEQSAKDWKKSN
jgi:hypothetical protein